MERPVFGHGYSVFARDYNLRQADYFSNGLGSAEEIANARYVEYCFNEYLQQFFEGAIIGLLLFCIIVSMPVAIFFKSYRKVSVHSYYFSSATYLVAFLVVSLTNFTIAAIPVMTLFTFFYSISLVTKS